VKLPGQDCEYNLNTDEQTKATDTETPYENSEPESIPTQIELITQWRNNLKCMLQDLGIVSSDGILRADLKDITPECTEKLNYLHKTNEQLDLNEDFSLSESGFIKYKSAHFIVIDFMTKKYQQDKKENKVKFYFFARYKHIKQETEIMPWSFSIVHFLLLIFTIGLFVFGAGELLQKTQGNGLLQIFIFLIGFLCLRHAVDSIKIFKNTALTPIRFIISLLSISLLKTFFYGLMFISIPILIVMKQHPFWIDDVIIVGMGALFFRIYLGSDWCLKKIENKNDGVKELANEEILEVIK